MCSAQISYAQVYVMTLCVLSDLDNHLLKSGYLIKSRKFNVLFEAVSAFLLTLGVCRKPTHAAATHLLSEKGHPFPGDIFCEGKVTEFSSSFIHVLCDKA